MRVCVCVYVVGGAAGAAAGDSPVPRQAQRRPRHTPLQELQLQPGADRTSLTPLFRRLRLKVSVRGITGGEGCAVPDPGVFGG